jgi:hypothetical protein
MIRKLISIAVLTAFVMTSVKVPAFAQIALVLPTPGTMVSVSPSFEPALIKGLTVHKDNPFLFDFIVDPGQSSGGVIASPAGAKQSLKDQANRMVRYFFAALTIPDKDIWVNLSPYEKDRMVPAALGQTTMGRDLLAQDYLLKQLTASLIYPQGALGKKFWDRIYSQAQEKFGTTQIPVNTFNKVWIVPQRAGVYEKGQTAFIVNAHLKVMLEEDYLSTTKHNAMNVIASPAGAKQSLNKLGSEIIRQIILPELEKEVNEGKNFATLRQIFYAQVLAVWFKHNLKQALLNRVYANKGNVKGIDTNASGTNEEIYRQYLQAYKKGVFNYIKEDIDPVTQETLPRKYFSGGYDSAQLSIVPAEPSAKDIADISRDTDVTVLASDRAMSGKLEMAALLSTFLVLLSTGSVDGEKLEPSAQVNDEPLAPVLTNNIDQGLSPGDLLKRMRPEDRLVFKRALVDLSVNSSDIAGKIDTLNSIIVNGDPGDYFVKYAKELKNNLRAALSSKGVRADIVLNPDNLPMPSRKDHTKDQAMSARLTLAALFIAAAAGGAGWYIFNSPETISTDPVVNELVTLKDVTKPAQARSSQAYKDIVAEGKKAVPFLVQVIKKTGADPNIRALSIALLGDVADLQDAEAIGLLEDIIDGTRENMHANEDEAGEALKQIKERAAAKLASAPERRAPADVISLLEELKGITDPEKAAATQAYKTIVAQGTRAVPQVLNVINDQNRDLNVRKTAFSVLGDILEPVNTDIIEFLQALSAHKIVGFGEFVNEAAGALKVFNQRHPGQTVDIPKPPIEDMAPRASETDADVKVVVAESKPFVQSAGKAPDISVAPISTKLHDGLIQWMRNNVFIDGMPRSFELPEDPKERRAFLDSLHADNGKWEAVIEGIIIENGLSIYDGSGRQMALTFAGDPQSMASADIYTNTLASGSWGALKDIRAYYVKGDGEHPFRYGDRKTVVPPKNSYFFRLLSPSWQQTYEGQTFMQGYPVPSYKPGLLVWPDWKPITGEQAWVMMGELQKAYVKYGHDHQAIINSKEFKLAVSLVPALKAMQSDMGAVYHDPSGTDGKDPHDISNENNFSVYAALRMLHEITQDKEYLTMMAGIESYLKEKGMSPDGFLWQGGFYRDGNFTATEDFAVDVQTWGILVLGPKKIDEMYGEGTALRMWQKTKELAGYYDENKQFRGVGFTRGHDVLSAEWTSGAVTAVLELALDYQDKDPQIFKELMQDVVSMLQGIESLRVATPKGIGYLYANKSTHIPFGWWGRRLPSLASTFWVDLLYQGKNPTKLGGETRWLSLVDFRNAVQKITANVDFTPTPAAPIVKQTEAVEPEAAPAEPEAAPAEEAVPAAPAEESAPAAPVEPSPAINKSVLKLLNQLRNPDPGAAHGHPAFVKIQNMGSKVYPDLKQIVLNKALSGDALKWAAYLAANLAPSYKEAQAFVNKLGSFEWYVKQEAANGLNAREDKVAPAKQGAGSSGAGQAGSIKALLDQLQIPDPTAAHNQPAFLSIQRMGNKAYPTLKQIVLTKAVSGDPLKWAAYLAANLAPSAKEAQAFVNQLDSYPDYVQTEANNGLNDRAMINGGIDLSEEGGILHIEKDAQGGVKINIDPAMIARIEREGVSELIPVIISMRPTNAQSLFGLKASI